MAEKPGFGSRVWEGVKRAAREMGETMVNRVIPQGRDELANALFNGTAYWPGQQPEPVEPEPPIEAQAAKVLDLEEAKEALSKIRAAEREAAGMTPDQPPAPEQSGEPQGRSRGRERGR